MSARRQRYSTGNEFITVDEIDTSTGAIRDLAFLYESARGTIVLRGERGAFLKPRITIDGQPVSLENARWRLINHWIPAFTLATPAGVVECVYLAPVSRKGIAVRVSFEASRPVEAEIGFELNWRTTLHVCDSVRLMEGTRFCGCLEGSSSEGFFSLRLAWPLFAIGVAADPACEPCMGTGDRTLDPATLTEAQAAGEECVWGACSWKITGDAGQRTGRTVYLGVGLEASSALASAQDLQADGWDGLFGNTTSWLEARRIRCRDEAARMEEMLNENALYNYFFSQGVTIDTERMVVTSSRSARYDYTGSYRDRDACLYSLPGVLLIDPHQARRMLEYVFSVQVRNVGARSRYMDGVLMRPGFALDALVSPIRALWMYVDLTNDLTILFDQAVQAGINRILEALSRVEHESIALYRTQITPAESPTQLAYVTADNVLVWRALIDLADLYRRIRDVERQSETAKWARDVRADILARCIVEGPDGAVFCHSTDLSGNHKLGDEPEGSLILTAHLELCRADLAAFRNTSRDIIERMKRDAPERQNVLALSNRLLAGDLDALEALGSAPMDGGIAAAWLDGAGCALAGAGWAACAGYLVYAIVRALEPHLDPPVLREETPPSARISRKALKPGLGWI